MPGQSEERSLSIEEIRVAAAHGHLVPLATRLVRERRWNGLVVLFEQMPRLAPALAELVDIVRATTGTLKDLPEPRGRAADEVRTVRLLAGESLLRRIPVPTLTSYDRQALAVAASALAEAGDLHRAALAFQQAEAWDRAAEVWGRLGELDEMEACLARDETARRTERLAVSALRDAEALIAAGEREVALRLLEGVPDGVSEAAAARRLARSLAARLVRTRSITLRTAAGASLRFAATPAVLGRDPAAEIALRDPAVSRQHALIAVVEDEVSLTDTGARGGTFVGAARLEAPFLVRGTGEIGLGPSCRFAYRITAPGRVVLEGLSGLDRGLTALVGSGPLPIGDLLPEAEGATLELGHGPARLLHHPELKVRIDGRFVSPRIDLMHGDALEIGAAGMRVEVE